MADFLLINTARQGDLEEVKRLLIDGADVNENRFGFTPLIWATIYGHFEIASLLIESGARINHQTKHGWTALHFASFNNRSSIVSLLIEKGADLNIKTNDEDTPLMRSASKGHYSIVSLLLKSGADVSLKGRTALYWARENNHSDCVGILEKYEHFHRYRKVWLSFSTSLSSFQDNQNQESKQTQSQSQIQSPSLMKVMDSSDLVRYLTEYM